MKKQNPVRVLLMSAVAASSTLGAAPEPNIPQFFPIGDSPNHPQGEDKNWGLETPVGANPSAPKTPIKEVKKEEPKSTAAGNEGAPKSVFINFNNINIVEYIRFISKISGKNFIFDEKELGFNVTIVSDGPTSIETIMTTLMQELRVHNYLMMEEGNSIIIYKNAEVKNVPKVSLEQNPANPDQKSEIVTQVFLLNTLDPLKAAAIVKPMLSKGAMVQISVDTRHIIVTDLVDNIEQVRVLLKGLDSPNSGLVIGQYVVRNARIETLIELTRQIIAPIANEQVLTFVPNTLAQSVFVVSSPFIVERALSVMQYVDLQKSENKIYNMNDLKFKKPPEGEYGGAGAGPGTEGKAGKWEIDSNGKWVFHPGTEVNQDTLDNGSWVLDPQGNWYFNPAGTKLPFSEEFTKKAPENLHYPKGTWKQQDGVWIYELLSGETIRPEFLRRPPPSQDESLPVGHIERTKFLLYKLKFRNGKDIVTAIESIATSLEQANVINKDLVTSVKALQWIEPTNSIIITGTSSAIEKIKELIGEIDTPLRQVFIEMLILETDVDDSLSFGVSWGSRAAGGSVNSVQAFIPGATNIGTSLLPGSGGVPGISGTNTPLGSDYTMGVIGTILRHNGEEFINLAALVRFLHDNTTLNIIMNPKIMTEDNKAAEIFVGENTAFQTESIANDQGNLVTTNYQFRDVGTTLNVTPHIGSENFINLEIKIENSSITTVPTATGTGQSVSSFQAGPTTSINRTTTNVNIPDGCFLILSGMIHDELMTTNNQIPCLGGLTGVGGLFKGRSNTTTKRNLMIFIRPVVIDSYEQMNELTKRNQDIYTEKKRQKEDWKHHMDEALKWLNLYESCDICEPCQ